MNISSADLRIDNLIRHNGSDIIVDSINEYGINISVSVSYGSPDTDYIPFKELQGVPLTEERLIKFGAKNHEKGFIIQVDENTFLIFERTVYPHEGEGFDGELMQTDDGDAILLNKLFQYVHEIQNLYFTLTGEELELK